MEYTAYGDYFDARKFPCGLYPEVRYETAADQGRKLVRNVQWRAGGPEEEAMAAVSLDLSGDGFADVTVVGKDRNHNGIPDFLEVNPVVRAAQTACSKVFPY